MNFIKPIRIHFSNLSDYKTVLYSAEGNVVIQSIRCCNKSRNQIRVNLQAVALLENPIQEAFLQHEVLILPNQTADLLSTMYANTALIVEHRMFNGDNLICYADSYQNEFDCTVVGYEEIENI